MDEHEAADREFWRSVLLAGGATAVPRWTLDPAPGLAEHVAPLDDVLAAAVRRLAEGLRLSPSTLALAAHARVLAALSGEPDVVTGYLAAPDGGPLPCQLSTRARSWRSLLQATARAEADLLRHRDFAVTGFARELGVPGPVSDAEFAPAGTGRPRTGTALGGGAVLRVGLDERLALRVRYRTDALDAGSAERIAGYHLTALALMVADPDAEHEGAGLLSEEELRFQLDGLAGPHRDLPDRRFHELFEQRVRMHPDRVAAVHRDRQWTYRHLNARANRLARALLARGLRREGVVAVVTERNLDWMTAVLAVLKAGGAYLPIEPSFPADRIATTLARADCTLVLTEAESTTMLDKALDTRPGAQKVIVEEACAEGQPCDALDDALDDDLDDDLGVAVTADQLAYIYFTSGSTGEPKGVMCEHAGLLNHLLAKIEDLGVGPERGASVVAQTAPQCFDISLWQLVSALLVGGRTLIVEQQVILDVERYVDTIVRGRVGVLQVVPSYLEAVLTYLERHPRDLPDLRCVSATGEALKKELVQRWFGAHPDIPLVNAYGLTETSDDTNHEVMTRVPGTDRVPLGRPIRNVHVDVVDEQLSPVPLGAPGEIVFSGVCVGRGYVNDPERTRRAFLPDPNRPGQRLYRSGDHGRWLPGGTLDFLGRRDSQVKVRGFRIEIGEVENALLRVPGVRDAAVVVVERAGEDKQLVAFYTGERPVDGDVVRARVGASLPPYMVPSALHWRDGLPLTASSKIDRKSLGTLAAELDAADPPAAVSEAPSTPTERRLAAAWAQVLGTHEDRISRGDHFFDLGGTSLSAVKLAIALNRAVSLKDIAAHPVLADLAALLDPGQHPDERPGPLTSSLS